MAKEILLYNPIYSYTAADFITQMEANKGSDVCIRMNCPGGEVYAAYGMFAKFAEHAKGKTVKVDGMAKSGGFFFCALADDVECLNVSDFMAHRAAMPSWIENDPEEFTDDAKASLNRINTYLKDAVIKKVPAAKFQEITGVSLDDMFSLNSRIDVNITAEQALAMGLVNRVIDLTASKKAEIVALSATHGIAAFSKEPTITDTSIPTIMTAAEFKSANPTAYAEIVKEGVTAERNRVSALMVFINDDTAGVAKAITDGAEMTPVMMAEFGRKMFAKNGIAAINEDGAATPIVKTEPVVEPKTAEAAAFATFQAEVAANRKNMIV